MIIYLWWREVQYWFLESLSVLIGGVKDSEGNIFIDGKPICDDYWDLNDAKVACRQLGFANAVNATQSKHTKF